MVRVEGEERQEASWLRFLDWNGAFNWRDEFKAFLAKKALNQNKSWFHVTLTHTINRCISNRNKMMEHWFNHALVSAGVDPEKNARINHHQECVCRKRQMLNRIMRSRYSVLARDARDTRTVSNCTLTRAKAIASCLTRSPCWARLLTGYAFSDNRPHRPRSAPTEQVAHKVGTFKILRKRLNGTNFTWHHLRAKL